jgi:hypothetical protein
MFPMGLCPCVIMFAEVPVGLLFEYALLHPLQCGRLIAPAQAVNSFPLVVEPLRCARVPECAETTLGLPPPSVAHSLPGCRCVELTRPSPLFLSRCTCLVWSDLWMLSRTQSSFE